jgi:hypothetical protein
MRTKRLFALTLFLILFLSACSGKDKNLVDGDKHVTPSINDAISDYIVQHSAKAYAGTEKQFEVHKVYGTSEKDGVLSVYMWSYYAGFNQATETEAQSGHSLPAVIRLKQDGDTYSVTDYTEPQDGSMYQSSLEKMFPAKYVKSTQRDSGNIGGLQKEMDKKVKAWLEKKDS